MTSWSEGFQRSLQSRLLQLRCFHRRWRRHLRTSDIHKQTDFSTKLLKTAVLFILFSTISTEKKKNSVAELLLYMKKEFNK